MTSSWSPSSNFISIVEYKRPFNIDLSSTTEYFSLALASDGNLDRGALRNGNGLFKDHYIHNINIIRPRSTNPIGFLETELHWNPIRKIPSVAPNFMSDLFSYYIL
ncbi:unnamed protein product [Adineta ricciae]|uniref:Uncharacterized protein n=1 Tax=Adineta ricciae TaxID=249248 RepID=A0A815TMU2_ADIRI|nr:unnamed protein product [Adineta ricciae]